jgi:ABC-type Fe3+ transport system substrate-binding protein
MSQFRFSLMGVALAVAMTGSPASAVELTAADQEMLAAKKLDAKILDGLDAELAVPQAWLDGAKKEGLVQIRMSAGDRQMTDVLKVFRARYPFLKTEYTQARGRELLIVPLLAYKQGTYVADMVGDFNGTQDQFVEAGALTKIDNLPGWKNIPDEYKRSDGTGIGWKIAYYCTAYNTEKVKPEDLPKTWDDLITNPRWGNQTVGVISRPHLWLSEIWGVNGDQWLANFQDKLFSQWKPQLRKESGSAITKLLAVNEFDLALPVPEFAVVVERKRGAPVGYHCPEPVPTQTGPLSVLTGAPHANAARLFINWMISKEGQMAVSTYVGTIPAHRELQRAEFYPFPATMMNRKMAPQTAAVLARQPAIMADWEKRWVGAGGEAQKGED